MCNSVVANIRAGRDRDPDAVANDCDCPVLGTGVRYQTPDQAATRTSPLLVRQ